MQGTRGQPAARSVLLAGCQPCQAVGLPMRVSCGPWGMGRGSGRGGTCRVLATFCWFACTTVTADTGCQTCFWIFILNCKPLFVAVVKRPRSGLSPAHRAPQWQLRLAVTMVSAPVPPGVRVNRELSPTGGLQAVKPKQLGSSTSPVGEGAASHT